jgi:DNA-binding IclR family transcriptional regulator
MAVLLLFNKADQLTHTQIEERTGLPEKELDRVLGSLVTCHLVKVPSREAGAVSFGEWF